jgi:hypothetical protein
LALTCAPNVWVMPQHRIPSLAGRSLPEHPSGGQ